MRAYILEHLTVFLFIALLIARIGDVLSTYLVTPTLKLEANPIVRKLRWPFALATSLVCFIPFYNTAIAIPFLVVSLMVSASNCSKIWVARAMGETKYYELMKECAQRSSALSAVLFLLSPCAFVLILGGLVLLFYPDPTHDWGFYIGVGIIAYALVLAIYVPKFFFHLRKVGSTPDPPQTN